MVGCSKAEQSHMAGERQSIAQHGGRNREGSWLKEGDDLPRPCTSDLSRPQHPSPSSIHLNPSVDRPSDEYHDHDSACSQSLTYECRRLGDTHIGTLTHGMRAPVEGDPDNPVSAFASRAR